MFDEDAASVVKVDWPQSHEGVDEFEHIRTLLEAGGDEGPLLVLVRPRNGPRGRTEPQMFTDVDCYIAHLASRDERPADERWVGIVRGGARDNGKPALAALDRLLRLAAGRHDPPRRQRAEASAHQPPYAPLSGAFTAPRDLVVENGGDGWRDVSDAFPSLPRRIEWGGED